MERLISTKTLSNLISYQLIRCSSTSKTICIAYSDCETIQLFHLQNHLCTHKITTNNLLPVNLCTEGIILGIP